MGKLLENYCRIAGTFATSHSEVAIIFCHCCRLGSCKLDVPTLSQVVRYTRLRKEKSCFLRKNDLFPGKRQKESVVTLSKGKIDSENVYVDFSLEFFDMSSFVGDPTYPQIKEYVLEHTGLKVSSLFIAQIKRKCSLGVGECYNKPKSENSRTYVCPPEKEKAIMDAFHYFGMI